MDTRVSIEGLTFDVTITGEGQGEYADEPVLLLHGFPQSRLSWARVGAELRGTGLRLVAPDQRGYSPGARPVETSAYAVEHLAADAIAIMHELGHQRFHLVGHDWGASVAWWLAAHHPDRIRTLTAVSVPHLAAYGWALRNDPDQQRRGSYLGVFRQPGTAEELLLADDAHRLRQLYGDGPAPADVETYLELMRDGALTPALSWYRAMGRELSELPAVTVPTTYVWSDEDTAVARAGAERCADFVTGDYRFVELPGISHWIPDEAPAELARAIAARIAGDE